ncbi:MAG TPA: hypothetical protein VJB88_08990 [Vicinamibacteria bacterium]|nr:hypothetical protein [Vicinamibacteria bacterium]
MTLQDGAEAYSRHQAESTPGPQARRREQGHRSRYEYFFTADNLLKGCDLYISTELI